MSEVTATVAAAVAVTANYLPKNFKFFFRSKTSENSLGEKVTTRRPTLELSIPVPTLDGLIELLNEGNATKIAGLMQLVEDCIYSAAKQQVDEDEAMTQERLDVNKLTMDYLFSLPPSQRASSVPPEELWKLFEADYPAIMASVQPNRTAQQIATARDLFLKRLNPVKERPDMLNTLKQYLALWYASTAQKEELAPVYEFLLAKADNFINQPPKVLDLAAI